MRSRPSSVRKLRLKINCAVESQPSIWQDINIQGLVIGRGIDESDLAGLHEVIGYDDVFLVGRYFDVMGADGGLDFVGVVKALDGVEVADVEGGDVVGGGKG